MIYKIKRFNNTPGGDAVWNRQPWRNISSAQLDNYMGSKPAHFPKTNVKVAYNSNFIYVMFRVEDRYVRAVAHQHHDPVYQDSCVEFFFTPGSDISPGYFNLEMNCGGTMLFHFHPDSRKEGVAIAAKECDKIIKAHSMPRFVEPEILEPVTWTVEYWIPINVLKNYCDVKSPISGTVWRANFYKCGDETSHPHWLTWAPVEFPKPNFHLPQFFGELEFE